MHSIQFSLSGRLWERPTGYVNTLEEQISLIKAWGYDGIEVRYPVLPTLDQAAAVKAKMQEVGLAHSLTFCQGGMPDNEEKWVNIMRVIKTISELGGINMRVVIPGPEHFATVREMAEKAQPFGVRVLVHYHINTYCDSVARAVETMEGIHHPNVGILFDPAHMVLAGDTDIAAAVERLFPWIHLINIQDFHRSETGDIKGYDGNWACHLPLDPGGIDFAPFVQKIKELGYKGFLNVMTAVFEGEDIEAIAKNYHAAFSKLL